MSLYQPNTSAELIRRNEKRLNRLERRANFGADVSRLAGRGLDNRIINGDFRINQAGYVSGATIGTGPYSGLCFDRWRASSYTNLAINPRARIATGNWAGQNGTVSRLTGISIPDLPGVTTAIRHTATVAGSGGPYTASDSSTPYLVVAPWRAYRITAWLRSSVARSYTPSAQFYTSGGAGAGSVAGAAVALAANTWTRVSWTLNAPITAARMGPFWYSVGNLAVGNTTDITGLMVTEGSDEVPFHDGASPGCIWLGTPDGSPSYGLPVQPTLVFTAAPQGQLVTLNSGARIRQTIERANMPAGTYVLSHAGTALVRVYNRNEPSPPPFTGGPLVVDVDGADHVVVEFEATAGARTIGEVSLIAGTTAYPFQPRLIGDELTLCFRYFHRNALEYGSAGVGTGAGFGTSDVYVPYMLPVRMWRVGLVECSAPSTFAVFIGTATATVIGADPSLLGQQHLELRFRLSSGGISGGAAFVRFASGGRVDVNAEFG